MQEIVGWHGKITLCQDLVGKKSSQQSPLFQQILPSAALSDNPDLHNSPDGIQVI